MSGEKVVTQQLRDDYKHQKMMKMLTDEINFLQKSVNDLVAISRAYSDNVDTALTKPKKDLYKKKLKKNNVMLYKVLRKLDQSVQVHELATKEAVEATND